LLAEDAADEGARRGVRPRQGRRRCRAPGQKRSCSGRPRGSFLGRQLGGQARAVVQHFRHGESVSPPQFVPIELEAWYTTATRGDEMQTDMRRRKKRLGALLPPCRLLPVHRRPKSTLPCSMGLLPRARTG
jgi:hypothetical protein